MPTRSAGGLDVRISNRWVMCGGAGGIIERGALQLGDGFLMYSRQFGGLITAWTKAGSTSLERADATVKGRMIGIAYMD
jgi:hypothetical protein